METLALSKIVPDENQPRKYFDATKMHSLKESIKKHGIMSPLIVEDMGAGKYLLVDGERRFRAATELKLKEVPIVIEKPTTVIERLVKQFNVQEQHEAWTPVEKAQALISLSKEMGLSLMQICKLLNIPDSVARKYAAFSELANKEAYIRSEIPLDYADQFKWVKNTVRTIRQEKGKDFPRQEEKKLESRLIKNVQDGVIVRRNDITKLKDAFKKEPKLIDEYLDKDDLTPSQLFFKAGAQGAYFLRNAILNATYLAGNSRKYLEVRDIKISAEQIVILKNTKKIIEQMIGLVE